jgi:hypothetical protein
VVGGPELDGKIVSSPRDKWLRVLEGIPAGGAEAALSHFERPAVGLTSVTFTCQSVSSPSEEANSSNVAQPETVTGSVRISLV